MKLSLNKLKIKHSPITIGILFSFSSLALSFTVIPIFLSIFFAAIMESFTSIFVEINPYPNFALFVLLAHVIFFLLFHVLLIRFILIKKIQKRSLFLIFPLFYLLNQSMANYLFWYLDCNFCGNGDGQVFFRFFAIIPVLMCCFIFLIQGILIHLSLKFIAKYNLFNSSLKQLEKEKAFESKVNSLIERHKNTSLTELQNMASNKNWTLEARIAAKKIIEQRT